jgi:hypothetical protein
MDVSSQFHSSANLPKYSQCRLEQDKNTLPGCVVPSSIFSQQLFAALEHCIHLSVASDDTKVSPRTSTVLGFS